MPTRPNNWIPSNSVCLSVYVVKVKNPPLFLYSFRLKSGLCMCGQSHNIVFWNGLAPAVKLGVIGIKSLGCLLATLDSWIWGQEKRTNGVFWENLYSEMMKPIEISCWSSSSPSKCPQIGALQGFFLHPSHVKWQPVTFNLCSQPVKRHAKIWPARQKTDDVNPKP